MAKLRASAYFMFALVLSFILLFSMWLHYFWHQYFYDQIPGSPSIFLVGYLLMPIGLAISRSQWNKRLILISWLAYIWMGFFFILSAFTFVYIFANLAWPEIDDHRTGFFYGVLILTAYSLFWGTRKPSVFVEKIKTQFKEFQGLKFVQITDLHVGLLHQNQSWLKGVVESCNQQSPDFLFLTGDLVEGSFQDVKPMLDSLKNADAKIAKIYISGNHEMIHGGLAWETYLKDLGWTVLHNQNRIYHVNNKKILIAGVPDKMINRFDSSAYSKPDQALTTTEVVDYRILLAHEPSSVFDLKTEKPDLLLSGHTHGGQIFPFGILVRLVQPVVSGWKTIQNVPVFAHPGTGLWGPPMRLGTRNSIYVFEMI